MVDNWQEWMLGAGFTAIFGLVGVVWSVTRGQIEKKVSREFCDLFNSQICTTMKQMQDDIHESRSERRKDIAELKEKVDDIRISLVANGIIRPVSK